MLNFALVSVPVLSKTMYFAPLKRSKILGFLIKTPCFAAWLIAQTLAIGAASPSAQGHEIIKTQSAFIIPSGKSKKDQMAKVIKESAITKGVKTFAILSAKRDILSLKLPLSCKSSKISANKVLSMLLEIFTFIKPFIFVVPAKTLSFTLLYFGKLSPVIELSSICAPPLIICPSLGILKPLFTLTTSPIFSSFTSIIFSLPSAPIKMAVLGLKSIKVFKKSLAFCFELASKNLPKSTKAIIIVGLSKYK